MLEGIPAPLIAISLMAGMLLFLELGRWVGKRGLLSDPEGSEKGLSTLESSILALFGLLVAFSFSGATERFDTRRNFITQEANDIGTAWTRIDLLPRESQPAMRDLFRKYLDSRLETYAKIPDMAAVAVEMEKSTKLQQEIWSLAVAGCEAKKDPASTSLILTSLNAVMDTMTMRTMATKTHPPTIVFVLLLFLALVCAFLAGHGLSSRKDRCWFHILGFALVIPLTIYVILDIEFPRFGYIRVDDFDIVLKQLRESMK